MGWVDAYTQGPFEFDVDAGAYIGAVVLYTIPICVLPLVLLIPCCCTQRRTVSFNWAAAVALAVIVAMLVWQTVVLASATPVGTVITRLETGFIETIDAVNTASTALRDDINDLDVDGCGNAAVSIENMAEQFTTISTSLESASEDASGWLNDLEPLHSYDGDIQVYGPIAAGVLLFTFILYGSLWATGIAKGCAASVPATIATLILWAVAIAATTATIMFADLCADADTAVLRIGGAQPQLKYYIECTGSAPEAAIDAALTSAKDSIAQLNVLANGTLSSDCSSTIVEFLNTVNGRVEKVETETGCAHIQAEYVAVRDTLCHQPFTMVLQLHQATVTALVFALCFFTVVLLNPAAPQEGTKYQTLKASLTAESSL